MQLKIKHIIQCMGGKIQINLSSPARITNSKDAKEIASYNTYCKDVPAFFMAHEDTF